jgi:hypothetical protein
MYQESVEYIYLMYQQPPFAIYKSVILIFDILSDFVNKFCSIIHLIESAPIKILKSFSIFLILKTWPYNV